MTGNLIRLDSTDSTNTYLKKLAEEGAADGTAVTAERQIAGRGRTGNRFASESGGLYLSYLIRTDDLEIRETTSITTKTAVAAISALKDALGICAGIKWVNDIILNRKKLGGILVEAGHLEYGRIPYVVTGIGINVNQEHFPVSISEIATSLYLETGIQYAVDELADAVLGQLDRLRRNRTEQDAAYLQEYRRFCETVGRTVCFERNGKQMICQAAGITDDYGLLVQHRDGSEEVLRSGEVHVRGLEGYL